MKRKSAYVAFAAMFFAIGSVATLLWNNANAQDEPKSAASVSPSPLKWEYKVVSENTQPIVGLNTNSIEGTINRLGEVGWECVGTIGEVKGGNAEANMTNAVLIFKRPKK